jgi:TP901 family phage tail tape measure protein
MQVSATKVMSVIGIGALSLTGIIGGLSTVTAQYKNQFLELQNLNLDKSQSQINALNDAVLRTAMDTGLAASITSKAYFDIQSATGKYGAEVDGIVNKLGKFSIATKTNMDALVNGTAKGMGIWQFGEEQIDNYLASMAKTVQVGVTTFDQLAQVQVDYAGSAAAVGQSFDSANKLFAVFSKSAKSVAEASTATKTAFQGLSDPKVQEGLKKYGVQLFDTNGKMLAIDEVAKGLVDTVNGMNDIQFSQFMGGVGGPEGLKMFLQQAKANGDGLLQTFIDFDNVKFDVGQAIKNANGDAVVLASIFRNQLNTALIMLGEQVLPAAIIGLTVMSDWLVRIVDWFTINGPLVVDFLQSIAIGAGVTAVAFGVWFIATNAMTGAIGLLSTAMVFLNSVNPAVWIALAIAGLVLLWKRSVEFRAAIMGIITAVKEFGRTLITNVWETIKKVVSGVALLGKAFMQLFSGKPGEAWKTAQEGIGNITEGYTGGVKAYVAAGKSAAKGFQDGYQGEYGKTASKDLKNKEFDFKNSTITPEGVVKSNTKTDPTVPITDPSAATSGSGSGGSGKTITVNMNITNVINANMDSMENFMNEVADKVTKAQVDALNDVLIQHG